MSDSKTGGRATIEVEGADARIALVTALAEAGAAGFAVFHWTHVNLTPLDDDRWTLEIWFKRRDDQSNG